LFYDSGLARTDTASPEYPDEEFVFGHDRILDGVDVLVPALWATVGQPRGSW
jgi:hypothetical protein